MHTTSTRSMAQGLALEALGSRVATAGSSRDVYLAANKRALQTGGSVAAGVGGHHSDAKAGKYSRA